MHKIGILGSNSFIGKHLIKLLQQDNVQLKLFTRNVTQQTNNLKTNYVYGDLEDKQSLEKFIEEKMIVINLIFLSSAGMQRNLQAITNLAKVCSEKRAKRLIHCSTISVYGDINAQVVDETHPKNPSSEYAQIKLTMEELH